MKRYSPVSDIEWKPMFFPRQQAVMTRPIGEAGLGSTGVLERGEYAKVKQAYLGGLTSSVSSEAKR